MRSEAEGAFINLDACAGADDLHGYTLNQFKGLLQLVGEITD